MPSDASEDPAPIILTEVAGRIGTITLNRPERQNALNGDLILALDSAVKTMADDDAVKVVILTGAAAPGRVGGFCSGGDTKDGGRVPDPARADAGVPPKALSGDLARHDRHAAMLLHQMPKPTIAMVGGPAVGAGCSLAAACDLRFASADAVFATMFSNNGLAGDYGGTFLWTRIVGTGLARELYLLNEKISAARALELGMVSAVVPPAELADYTREVAERLARMPASLLALVKDNLNEAEDTLDRRRHLFASEAENQERAAADLMERMRSKAHGTSTGRRGDNSVT